MSDAEADGARRPAPQYGEYATPEQQRESILRGGGVVDDGPAAERAAPAVTRAPIPPDAPPPASTAHGASAASPAAPASAARSLRGDRIVTIVLLAYGLYTVVTTIPQLLDVAGFADTWMQMAGVDATFTNYDEGVLWGRIAAFVFAIGWLLTALWCWLWIGRRRRAFWIPIVGAVVSFVLVSACLTVPIIGDPALVAGIVGAR